MHRQTDVGVLGPWECTDRQTDVGVTGPWECTDRQTDVGVLGPWKCTDRPTMLHVLVTVLKTGSSFERGVGKGGGGAVWRGQVWNMDHANVSFSEVNSLLTTTGKISVMTGTLLCMVGSCGRHSELTEEMYIPLVHVDVILN